jgi:hypothetical protein
MTSISRPLTITFSRMYHITCCISHIHMCQDVYDTYYTYVSYHMLYITYYFSVHDKYTSSFNNYLFHICITSHVIYHIFICINMCVIHIVHMYHITCCISHLYTFMYHITCCISPIYMYQYVYDTYCTYVWYHMLYITYYIYIYLYFSTHDKYIPCFNDYLFTHVSYHLLYNTYTYVSLCICYILYICIISHVAHHILSLHITCRITLMHTPYHRPWQYISGYTSPNLCVNMYMTHIVYMYHITCRISSCILHIACHYHMLYI